MRTEQHWRDIFRVVLQETDVVIEVLDARNPMVHIIMRSKIS